MTLGLGPFQGCFGCLHLPEAQWQPDHSSSCPCCVSASAVAVCTGCETQGTPKGFAPPCNVALCLGVIMVALLVQTITIIVVYQHGDLVWLWTVARSLLSLLRASASY